MFFMNVNRVDKVFQIYKNNSARKVKLNGNKCRKDELDLSSKAVEYQSAFIKIKELPEIRENKVKKIGNEIKTGNYKIDGENIVDRIIERINFDKRI